MLHIATLNIQGMTCATCSGAIERLLRPLNGIKEASVSLLMNQAVIEYDENIIKIDDIIEEIEDIGFDANLSSVSKKRDTPKKTKTQNRTTQMKNVIIWSSIVGENYDETFFYNITNSLPGIIKIKLTYPSDRKKKNNNTKHNLFIHFDKTIILPMTITHLLQAKHIKLSDISVSKAYPNEEKKEHVQEQVSMSELKKISFAISNLNINEVNFNAIKTRLGETLIESISTKTVDENEEHNILLIVEFYDIMDTEQSTARMIYNYLLNELNILEKNISIIDAQTAERDDFRASQVAIVKKIQKQFYLACLFGIPCFIIAMLFPHLIWINHNILMYNPIPGNHSVDVMGLLLFALATPVQFWIGRTFYISAWNAAKHGTSNMSTLIALGTTVAYAYSFIALVIDFFVSDESLHGAAHFFETSATVITIVLLGKWLQAKAKFKTCDAIGLLMDMQSPFATKMDIDEYGQVLNNDGYEISTELIIEGDIIKIKRGGQVALDGTIIYGTTSIDERMITGESVPRNVTIGDVVISSSINCGDNGMILIRVDKCKSDSVISKIIKLMKDSQTNKPKQQEFADLISSYFVPLVVLISILTFGIWYSLCSTGYKNYAEDQDCTFFAILFSMAVMVIACPCALGLATPTAVMVGMGVATKYGCLIKGGNVLEIAHNLNIIVFDKTGTLTYGKPKVVDFVSFDNKKSTLTKEEILYCLGCSELNSEHPLAKAMVVFTQHELRKYNRELITPQEFEAIPGKGIKALVGKHHVFIGNFNWFFGDILSDSLVNEIKLPKNMHKRDVAKIISKRNKTGNITLLISIDFRLVAYVCLFDSPRPQSKHIIHLLQTKYNLKCVMLTGDTQNTAAAVAKAVGIDAHNVISQVLPQDKHQVIKELQFGVILNENKKNKKNNNFSTETKETSAFSRTYGMISMQKTEYGLTSYKTFEQEEKQRQQALNKEGEEKYLFNVAMVGDGINDAAALSQANLGIAIGNGADIAMEASDVVLMNDNLFNIAMLIDLSSTIIHRIYLNFVWALGFNCLGIPIAAGVLYPTFKLRLPPEVAAIAMACSSLCVLVSSILLKRYRSPYTGSDNKNIIHEIKQSQLKKDVNKHGCGCGLICACKQKVNSTSKENIYVPIKRLLPNVGKRKVEDESDDEEECLCTKCKCDNVNISSPDDDF